MNFINKKLVKMDTKVLYLMDNLTLKDSMKKLGYKTEGEEFFRRKHSHYFMKLTF